MIKELKLKNNFFEQRHIKRLRRFAGGDTYVVIYLEMMLLSLENKGKLEYIGERNNIIEQISAELGYPTEEITRVFEILRRYKKIEGNIFEEIEFLEVRE